MTLIERDMDDLKALLRAREVVDADARPPQLGRLRNPDGPEAAARIEALEGALRDGIDLIQNIVRLTGYPEPSDDLARYRATLKESGHVG